MREASFLSSNENKWRKVESILKKDGKLSPDESVDLFVELSDDLSYARTHYPESVTTHYLNALASGIFQKLNMGRREKLSRLVHFWKFEVPYVVGKNHRILLFVTAFFLFSVIIGVVSTNYDESFPRTILGDDYVNMTIHNIEEGDPMAVYKSDESNRMFLRITFNNIRVAAYTFAAGFLFSLGALYFLFVNGVMLGTFQYFFVTKGLFLDSFLTIWIHGTIEIASIIIAGAAGVVLGNSLLFPGTLPRKQSVMGGGKEAIKILISVVPLFIVAGFLEGFITRLTESPMIIRGGIIGLSFVFLIWYFGIYARKIYSSKK